MIRSSVKSNIFKLLLIIFITFFASSSLSIAQLVVEDNVQNSSPRFAKGRFIVKLKSPEVLEQDTPSSQHSTHSTSSYQIQNFQRLNSKHKVKGFTKIHRMNSREADLKAKVLKIKKGLMSIKDALDPEAIIYSESSALSNTYIVEVPEDCDIEAAVEDYRKDLNVEYAQPDYEVQVLATMNDPLFNSLWGLTRIDSEQAWDISQGSGIVVAIVDTGIDYTHEDLAANMWTNTGEIPNNNIDDDNNDLVDDYYGFDFANSVDSNNDGDYSDFNDVNDSDPIDGHGHGTHIAGVVAAVGNNNTGVVGVAPMAKLMAVKGIGDNGTGFSSNLAFGIGYAALSGADVISNSWACINACPSNPVLEEAILFAHNLGVVVVIGAGNSNADMADRSPQNMRETLTVGASDQNDNVASFSNFGSEIDVVAPGVSIRSTTPNDNYTYFTGTSIAAPHVSGLAALVLSNNTNLTNEEVRHIIRSSAVDIDQQGFDIDAGHGLINSLSALQISSPLIVKIDQPTNDDVLDIANHFDTIVGTVSGSSLDEYTIEYKPTDNSEDWLVGAGPFDTQVNDDDLGNINLNVLIAGNYFIKVSAVSNEGHIFEDVIEIETTGTPSNRVPVAQGQIVNTNQNVAVGITLAASDQDNDPLSFSVVTQPDNGFLTGIAPNLTYRPDNGFIGNDVFTFKANDGADDSNIASINISVHAIVLNNAPVAQDQNVNVDQDDSVGITLVATDQDNDALTYSIISNPSNGTLSGSGASRTYTPNNGFSGSDNFTFRANDGEDNSNTATVSITVDPVNINTAPVAQNQNVNVDQDDSVGITLVATDQDNDALTYSIISNPSNGTLSGTGASRTYTPNNGFSGQDSFTFRANDGEDNSNTATVNIGISPVISSDSVAWVDVVGSNVSGNSISKSISTAGWTSGARSTRVIAGNGLMNFAPGGTSGYRMIGLATSNPNTEFFSINYTIYLSDGGVLGVYESGVNRGTFGSYVGSDRLSIERTGTTIEYKRNGIIFYTSAVASNGSLMVDVSIYSQGTGVSDVSIIGAGDGGDPEPDNNAPVAQAQSVSTNENVALPITLVATDADGDTLTYSIVGQPSNGTLSGTAPNVTYTPNNGFNGQDSFTFRANDGEDNSNIATVSITVDPVQQQSSSSPIVWTEVVGVSVSGNTITRLTTDGGWTAGARSTEVITGDGGMNFRANTISDYRMVGLATVNTSTHFNVINYAIYLSVGGLLNVYESGVSRGNFGVYAAGDRLSVERVGTTVSYKKNGVTFYTSTVSSSGVLIADTSIYSGSIEDTNITSGASGPVANNAPVAQVQSVSTNENVALPITLVATDADGDTLTYSIVGQPSNGTLSGTAPNVTYTPNNGFNGQDSFTFRANDGEDNSNIATVSITVDPLQQQSSLSPIVWTEVVGVSVSGNTITRLTTDGGWTEGARSTSTVTGNGGMNFRANSTNYYRMAGLATVNSSVHFNVINYAIYLGPGGSLQVYESGVSRGGFGSYAVGDRLSVERVGTTVSYKKNGVTFYTSTVPSSGSLIADASIYSGSIEDANITSGASGPGPVANNEPVANAQSVSTNENVALPITLVATDADGDTLTYSIVGQPSNGTLSGTAPNVTYTPNNGFNGQDSFTFRANDGEDNSNIATVSITVDHVQQQSSLSPIVWTEVVGVSVSGNTITRLTTDGGWTEGARSTSTVTGNGGMNFRANSTNYYRMAGLATVNSSVHFNVINYAIYLGPGGSLQVYESGVSRGGFGSYAVGDRLSVERVGTTVSYKKNGVTFYTSTVPSSGSLIADASIYSGSIEDANITSGASGPGPVANNEPVANAQSVSTNENVALPITLVATDADGDTLTYSIVGQPSNGTLSGTAPNVTYTPNNGFNGQDSFTFRANDGEDNSNIATVSITVDPVQQQSSSSPIVWTEVVGVSVSGNTITRLTTDGGWTAGARSTEVITGDGGMNFRANTISDYRMVGLATVNTSTHFNVINYAIYLSVGGLLNVYESGVSRGNFGVYAAGDRLSVERVGTTVSYKKNGVTFYTSTVSSSGVLIADTSIYSGAVQDANIIN